ncbi:HAMP domain-containing sensor histidine kinase [Pseudonocardia sp. GCM10023141]|uniref:HAMP domain-containing sensor histidine kinase n=1 Tax=Pseudonocardia sp. GCM10023141 TaxID=3252653 RepID=UPI00360F1A77
MRVRIVGLTVLAAILAIALFGLPLAAIVAKYLIDDERSELERKADVAALALSAELTSGLTPTDLPAVGTGSVIALYDPTGRLLLGTGPPALDASLRRVLGGEIRAGDAGPDFVVAVPISKDGAVTGVIRAATGRFAIYLQIGGAWLLMAALAVVALGGAWLMARRQAARLSRPLEQLSDTAGRLGDGDLTARVPPSAIPEIDAVGTALNRTAGRLGDQLARERAFSADASHQLRTPLAGLRLTLETALEAAPESIHSETGDSETGDSDRDLRRAITTAISSADRLERTVEDLLALARDTTRGTETLHVAPLLDELAQRWREALAGGGRTLRIALPPDIPTAAASTAAIRETLDVLLSNAVRHGAGTVTVTARDAGDAMAIDVSDAGAVEETATLFERRAPGAAGHGIGLAMARSLVEAEGGRLVLTATTPTTFTALLPVQRDTAPTLSR